MPDLYIQHVIFTRVESEYSLNQNSGYQIVYQSPSIGTEIGQIEKSLQCFPINDQHIDRYQFFWTEKGQAVIAKSVSLLKPNRNVIDRDQRDAFLAHAIIVSREEFVRVKNDPFAVFEAAEHANLFAEDVEKLVLYLRQAPPSEQIHIPIRQKSRRVPVGWSNKELLKLYVYAQQASTTTRQGQSFLMVSADQDEIVSLLSIVHLLLAPDERSACTFDTCIDTCSPTAGIFWIIGGTKALNNAGYISLLLAEWKIESKSESRKVPNLKATTYSIWLYDALQNSTAFQEIHNQLYIAHVIFEALTTKRMHPDSSLLNQSTLESFHKVNRHLIDSKVQTALTAWLGKRIAVDMATSIYSYLPSPDLLSIAAQETCYPQTLAPVVYRWILKEQQGFKQWNNILPLAKQTGYAPLLLLVSVKAQSWKPFFQDDTLRTQAIKALLISGTLSQALHDLWQTWLTPAAFVTAESALTIMDYIHPDKLQDDKEFQELLEVLLSSGVGGRLTEAYIQCVATLQNKSAIITLARTVKQTTNVTPGLKQALQLCSESFQSKGKEEVEAMTSDELSNLLAQIRTIINNLFDKISRWLESSSSKKELTERTAIEGETIRCPRCLLPIQISSSARQDLICRRCGLPIPLTYVREYKNIPSVFIQLIGLPSTGKTTFLDTLLIHLYNMDQVWPDFYTRPLSQLDLAHKQMLSVFWEKGRPPRSTQKSDLSQIDVYSIYLNHMERWRSCFLILMDHPGEYFTGLNIPIEQTPFLQHTPVTILLLSLPDMQREGKRMEDLINSYITSLEKIGVDFAQERRKIIIVFNKADLIPDLPQPLHEYLISDNIHMSLRARIQSSPMDKAALAAYLKRMEQISDIVRDWVAQNIPGGRILLSMLQSKGIDAKFTVMSATGHELSRHANLVEPSPRRVLDPFFWVLEFYNRSWYEQQATPSQNQRT